MKRRSNIIESQKKQPDSIRSLFRFIIDSLTSRNTTQRW